MFMLPCLAGFLQSKRVCQHFRPELEGDWDSLRLERITATIRVSFWEHSAMEQLQKRNPVLTHAALPE